jgi:non-specific serine/threonine protein kinase
MAPTCHAVFRLGRYRFEAGRQLSLEGTPIKIGARALGLLEALVLAEGSVVSKEDLLSTLWPGSVVVENALQQHACALRRALGAEGEWIVTVSGLGYRFSGPIEPERESADAEPGNLPLAQSVLVGREHELCAIHGLMDRHRLLTLTGPGGIGKSRLALEAARQRSALFPDGVFLVELTHVATGRLVAPTAAAAVGAIGRADELAERRLQRSLGHALLVLDNCEHVLEAAASLAQTLLRRCPRLAVLATSQEPLALEGEQVFRVGMLAVPEIDGNEAALADAPALRLFLIRVREQDHAFCPDASALQSAAELCRRLDGNPLAIELAAAQVPLLGVEGVVRRLSQRFRLLAAGRRTAPAKHRTLKGLMDWSYSLLDSTEQSALRQLGVFAGGFAVEDAISILSDQSCREDAERTLHHLHARSLVATVGVRKRERCTLLETT